MDLRKEQNRFLKVSEQQEAKLQRIEASRKRYLSIILDALYNNALDTQIIKSVPKNKQ